MVDLDFTGLKIPVKRHDNCVVIDVSSGSFPRYIEVRMPGTDGARRTAIWDGLLNLANSDKVMCDEYPGQPILRIVGFGGDQDASTNTVRVTQVWKSDLSAAAWSTNATGDLSAAGAYDLTTTGDLSVVNSTASGYAVGDHFGVVIKNTSGTTANAGDVGYLDGSNEYQTTTTAEDEQAHPVAVVVGGANNADIYVTKGPGRMTLNYAGSAPSSGDFLTFSTTAGSVVARTTMHPGVLARASAGGSGGTVQAELLLRTIFIPLSDSNLLYRCLTHSDYGFTATINGAPSATSVVYTVSTGNEDTIVPFTTNYLGLLRLFNSTRGDYRLITAVDTGTNTITTVSSTDSWADTDSIDVESSAPSTGTPFYEFDLTQQTTIPETARSILIDARYDDSGGAGEIFSIHPLETYAFAKEQYLQNNTTTAGTSRRFLTVRLIDQAWAHRGFASGSGTAGETLAIAGAWVAI